MRCNGGNILYACVPKKCNRSAPEKDGWFRRFPFANKAVFFSNWRVVELPTGSTPQKSKIHTKTWPYLKSRNHQNSKTPSFWGIIQPLVFGGCIDTFFGGFHQDLMTTKRRRQPGHVSTASRCPRFCFDVTAQNGTLMHCRLACRWKKAPRAERKGFIFDVEEWAPKTA